jgi:hypothetical protein
MRYLLDHFKAAVSIGCAFILQKFTTRLKFNEVNEEGDCFQPQLCSTTSHLQLLRRSLQLHLLHFIIPRRRR